MYNEIKANIIKKFFNKFLYTSGCSKSAMINKIIENSIFSSEYDYDTNVMTMTLGDNINLAFEFNWENTSYISKPDNKEIQHYKLIKVK